MTDSCKAFRYIVVLNDYTNYNAIKTDVLHTNRSQDLRRHLDPVSGAFCPRSLLIKLYGLILAASGSTECRLRS